MAYITSNKNQNWLLPMSIKDMVPKGHICFLVEGFVESLDFSNFNLIYGGAGHPAYHPRIIMKILIYGMLCKVRSTRKLASATRENFVFIYLAEKVNPDFRTINRFRKDNPEFVKDSFRKTVELATKHNLVDLSFISIDGSMLKASASKKQYFDKKGLDKLDKAIDKMVEEDIALGDLEEEMFGDKEEGLTGVDERDLKRIVRDYRKKEGKKKLKKSIKKAKGELDKYFLKKVSISDPEARMMLTKKGFSELSYNAQLSVSKNQIIVANDITQDKHDANQFVPQIKNIQKNIKLKKDTKVGLDCSFSSGDNIKFAEDNRIDLYVPSRTQAQKFNGKEQTLNHDNYEYDWKRDEIIIDGNRLSFGNSYIRKDNGKKILVYHKKGTNIRKQVPEFFKERLRMREKMEKPESKRVYDLRMMTVEPVYGNLKENLGFRQFLLRGLEKVKTEFNLVCIAHNLQKIWRLTSASSC